MKALNFYEILGVAPDATPEQIKAAFRQLAKKWHPDRHATAVLKTEATRQMQSINAAHDVLKDSAKRQKYDLRLANQPSFSVWDEPTASPWPRAQPQPRRQAPRSNPWQRAAPRPEAQPRRAPQPPPDVARNEAREQASAQRFERANDAVRAYFDALIVKYPDQKAKLVATLRWQMTKQNAAVRKGFEAGESEAASLARWVRDAKRAGSNRIETAPFAPRDPNRPQPKAAPTTPLDQRVTESVKTYFDDLISRHPLDKQPLRAALDWQMTRKKTEIARLIRAGQSEENALWRWALEARQAADSQIKKRK
jgi:curved DNA-binding protein CbpA